MPPQQQHMYLAQHQNVLQQQMLLNPQQLIQSQQQALLYSNNQGGQVHFFITLMDGRWPWVELRPCLAFRE
jgi:hypothetical protein